MELEAKCCDKHLIHYSSQYGESLIQSCIDEMPEDQKFPWTGAPAHKEEEDLVPSKPGEVVSKVTSHRIDPGHGPHTGSQDQVLGKSPPSLSVHAQVCQRNITCWSGQLHQEEHSTNKTDSKVQRGRYKHRGLRSCGTQAVPGEVAQDQEVTCVQHHTSPWTGR